MHKRVHEWFAHHAGQQWATCAIAEKSVIRVPSQPHYQPGAQRRGGAAAHRGMCGAGSRVLAVRRVAAETRTRLLGSAQVTDVYLLALAVAHAGRFVTLNRNVALTALEGATDDHRVVV